MRRRTRASETESRIVRPSRIRSPHGPWRGANESNRPSAPTARAAAAEPIEKVLGRADRWIGLPEPERTSSFRPGLSSDWPAVDPACVGSTFVVPFASAKCVRYKNRHGPPGRRRTIPFFRVVTDRDRPRVAGAEATDQRRGVGANSHGEVNVNSRICANRR